MRNRKQALKPRNAAKLWRRHALCGVLLLAAGWAGNTTIAAAADGAALFEAKCAACHSVGGGPKFGPDLKGVVARLGRDGAILAIVDPAKAGLAPGMPKLGLTQPEAEAISAYLDKDAAGSAATQPAAAAAAAAAAATPEEIDLGRKLFDGNVRFAKGGPACNACHHVSHANLAGGGTLAAELTRSYSRSGEQGLSAMIADAPFPVMQVAYANKPVQPEEIRALTGFLQQADTHGASQPPRSHGWNLFFGGAGGVVVLAGLFALIGGGRRKRSVNQDIYDRQIKSE
jgi:mono/diheme cytochrome c family protein